MQMTIKIHGSNKLTTQQGEQKMKTTILTALMLMGSMAFAEVYKIDTAASKVEWRAGKKMGTFHNGEVKLKGGEINTDKNGQVVNGNFAVDMKSITNQDLTDATYNKKLVGHLSSDDFFKVDKFPESTFALKSITPKAGSKDEYFVKGDLTMIGNTQPIEFSAKISPDKNTISGTAKITVERLKWGLQYGSGSLFKSLTADKIINDTFDLTLNLVAKK
jgi:polyisoprenoid-binding protein YceI